MSVREVLPPAPLKDGLLVELLIAKSRKGESLNVVSCQTSDFHGEPSGLAF